MPIGKREIRKLLLEAIDVGKKAEKALATPDSLQSFLIKCNTNKSAPKLLRDAKAVGSHASQVIHTLENGKDSREKESTLMGALARFAGKAIAAAIKETPAPKKGGGSKKRYIPAALRKQVWNHYIGAPIGETKCPVCRINTIDKLGFEAGHVIPECNGGSTTLENLRPICGECNRSMGTLNLQEYAMRYYGYTI